MLLVHPRIYLDARGEVTDALLIRDGVVLATGPRAREQGRDDERIEPDGACIMPALADAHVHLWGLGLRPGTIDLREAHSSEEVYARLRTYDPSTSPSGWVLGRDWDQHRWPQGDRLDRDALDALFPDHPVSLRRVDSHALWVNSRALELANISDGWQPAAGGQAGQDARGRLDGLLVDDAMDPVLAAIPQPTEAEDEASFRASCDILKSHGIASAHIAWMPLDRLAMLERLAERGELPLRLYLMLDGRGDALDEVLSRGPIDDPWLAVRAVKFFADGALGSQGADVLGGYRDGARGLVLEDAEALEARAVALAAKGFQVAVHAIGDAATRRVLDAFEAIPGPQRRATRPRVEHAQMVRDEDLGRFGELDVIASVQPIHMFSDAAWADRVLDAEQMQGMFAWRRLAEVTVLAAGSDYPIEDPNPWHAIATAMSRRASDGRVFQPEDALDAATILGAYTEGAAYASHRERTIGRLHPGYQADLIALDRDPFRETPQSIWDTICLRSWVAGQL